MNEENLQNLQDLRDYKTSFLAKKSNVLILDKIIKWCLYILIALLPLWFLPVTLGALDLDKQVLLVGLLSVALIAWLGRLLTQENIKWYKGLVVFLFFGFVIIYGLATIFSIQPYESLMGLDSLSDRAFINILYFFALFLLLTNYPGKIEERRVEILRFLTIFLVSAAIVGVFGLFQILGKFIFPWDFTKTTSFNTIGTVTNLGIFLVALLPLVFSLLLGVRQQGKEESKTPLIGFKIFLVFLAAISLFTILLLNFRILWIIAAVGMMIITGFWLSKRYILPAHSLSWLAIPVIILALCLIFLLFKPGSLFDFRLPLEIGLTHRGGWSIDKEVIQRNPILGTGPGTFIYNYSLYKPENINQTVFWNLRFTNAPSEILSLISEVGILGLIALLALIGAFLFKVIKNFIRSEEELTGSTGIKIGLFSSWLVLAMSWFFYPQSLTLIFVFWLFFTFLVVMTSDKSDARVIDFRGPGKIALIASFGFIIAVIVVIGLLYFESSKFIGEVKYKTGIEMIRRGELDNGINKVIRATVANPYEDKFYRNLAQFFLVQIRQNLNNQKLTSEEQARRVQMGISNAVNSAVRATTLNSKNVLNWISRGSIYRNLLTLINGAGDWAIKSYQEALGREPSNPFIYTEIARTYVDMADLVTAQAQQNEQAKKQIAEYLNKAAEAYSKAIGLKPNYAPAHFEIALVYDRQGKTNEAIAKMEDNKKYDPKDTGVAFQLGVLYYKSSQFSKAKQEFQRAVALDTNYSNARYFLGLLYDREGDKEAAIEQFEKIAELNPENNLVKQILANLRAGRPALGSPELGPPEQPEEIPIEEEQAEEKSRFQLPQ